MSLLRNMLGTYLGVRYRFHKLSRTGAFGPETAEYIDPNQLGNGHPLKRALAKYYVKQFHEASCSVASIVTLINALGTLQSAAFKPITQMEILDRVRTAHWKERMGPKGHNGRRGLPLPILKQVLTASLKIYHIDFKNIIAVQAVKNNHYAKNLKAELLSRLLEFEELGRGVIIAHFDQGAYIKSENIPHISPVGGFDPISKKVTMLDVDRFQEYPYQIGFEKFYQGLASNYHHLFRPFGYGRGGYIWVELNVF